MKEIFEFIFPGLMLMWVSFIGNAVFSDILEEHRSHTIARMVTSGVSAGTIVVAKYIRCLVTCWICELLLIVFTGLVFDVQWKSPLHLFIILTSFNLFLVGFLALVYGHARTADLANGIIVLVLMMCALIGGAFMPFRELPDGLQQIGRWTMIRIGYVGIETTIQSGPAWDVLRPSLQLAIPGLALAGMGAWGLRRRFESGQWK